MTGKIMQQHYKKELKIPKNEEEAREVLEINGELTQEKINKAYRKLALTYHPDKHSGCDGNRESLVNTNIRALNQARDLLINILENTAKKEYYKKVYNKRGNETSKTKYNKKNVKPNIANSFINKNLERARKLIKQKDKNIPLELFVKNACEDNRWCELFEEFLSKWSDEIDLDANVIIVSDIFESIECTVLYYACIKKNRSVAELLLRYKADVNKVSPRSTYKVPICSALKDNDYDLVFLLFQYGAEVDVTTEVERKIIDNSYSKHSKYTKETMEILLQYASPEQNTEILKYFSDSNISTNVDIEVIQLLLKKGADPDCGNPSAMEAAIAKSNTQLEQLFHNYLARQLKNLQAEKNKAPLAIVQKEGTILPKCSEINKETTTLPITKEVNSRLKVLDVLTLNPTAPSGDIRNQLQEKEFEVVQDADINNNWVAEQPNKTTSLRTESENNEKTDNRSFQEESNNQPQILTQSNTKSLSQPVGKSHNTYGNIRIGCCMAIGVAIIYLAGAMILTSTIPIVTIFTAAVVSTLVGYGIGKFYEKISAEKQKDCHMSIGTAIKDILAPECLKPRSQIHL